MSVCMSVCVSVCLIRYLKYGSNADEAWQQTVAKHVDQTLETFSEAAQQKFVTRLSLQSHIFLPGNHFKSLSLSLCLSFFLFFLVIFFLCLFFLPSQVQNGCWLVERMGLFTFVWVGNTYALGSAISHRIVV